MNKKIMIAGMFAMIFIALTLAAGGYQFSADYTEGMYGYYTSTNPTIPKYRTWNGTTNSSEGNAIAVDGNPEWVAVKAGTTRREKLMGVLTSTGVVNVQVYDGDAGIWSNSTNMTTAIGTTNDAYHGFDIAYETNSSRGLIVYNNNTVTPAYRIWNGTAFEAEGSLQSDSCTGTPVWIIMASHPTTNEVVEVDLDTNGDLCAQVWNGTSWKDQITLDTAGSNYTYKFFDVIYEQSSGNVIVVWQGTTDGQMRYKTLSGGIWGTSTDAGTDVGDLITWVDLAAMNSTDRVMMTVIEGPSQDVNALEWNGTAWGTVAIIDTTAEEAGDGIISVAYIGSTGDAMLVYVDNNAAYPSYTTCTGAANCFAGTWSAPAQTPGSTNCGEASDLNSVQLETDRFTDRIMLTAVSQATHYKCAQEYNGTGWESWNPNLGSGLSLALGIDFAFAYDNFKDFDDPAVILVSPANNTTSANSTNTFYYNVSDTSPIANCSLALNGATNQTNSTITKDANQTFTVSGMVSANYTWSVNCTDIYENENNSETYNLTVDLDSPQISNVQNQSTTNGSTDITWTTDEAANSTVEYGTTLTLGNISSSSAYTINHNISLANLLERTLYHYNVTSCDPSGNCNTTGPYNFTTTDLTPPTISSVTSVAITTSKERITWTTDENANSTVEYGTGISLGTYTYNTAYSTSQGINLTGLISNTLYYYNATSCDTFGNCQTSGGYNFTTAVLSGGGGSGGGGARYVLPAEGLPEEEVCTEDWICDGWGKCNINERQTRECADWENCGTEQMKPITERSCIPVPEEGEEMPIGIIEPPVEMPAEIKVMGVPWLILLLILITGAAAAFHTTWIPLVYPAKKPAIKEWIDMKGVTEVPEKATIREFKVKKKKDFREIINFVREGPSLVLINTKEIRRTDFKGLTRAVKALKKTIEAEEGDILGLGTDCIIVTSYGIKIARPEKGRIDEKKKET